MRLLLCQTYTRSYMKFLLEVSIKRDKSEEQSVCLERMNKYAKKEFREVSRQQQTRLRLLMKLLP
jgi:hypothetical protein